MKVTDKIEITNEDNMELMKRYPDNYFDLAIVDPPYGLGDRLVKGGASGGMGSMRNLADNKVEDWDEIPTREYFLELFRVSKNQIIWGGNYFLDFLGATDGFVVWNKMNGTNPMADCELAWQNVKGTTRMFSWHHFSGQRTTKIHPTQKPIPLYEWLLMNYAPCKTCRGDGCYSEDVAGDGGSRMNIPCDDCYNEDTETNGVRILDTHLGSGSIAIACHNLDFELTACELDKDYYEASIKRIKNHIAQQRLF